MANRNLEDPAFIHFNNLSEIQIALVRDDYIKREVLKREALNWGLDKVDPIISSRLAQLGEQFLANNLPNEDLTKETLNSFYNENKHFYIDDAKVTFSGQWLVFSCGHCVSPRPWENILGQYHFHVFKHGTFAS